MRRLISLGAGVTVAGVLVAGLLAQGPRTDARRTIATQAEFRQAMKELSNWGRWGQDDELGASNLITPAKRKQAAALVKAGVTVSLAHDVMQDAAPEGTSVYGPSRLDRVVLNVTPTGAADPFAPGVFRRPSAADPVSRSMA